MSSELGPTVLNAAFCSVSVPWVWMPRLLPVAEEDLRRFPEKVSQLQSMRKTWTHGRFAVNSSPHVPITTKWCDLPSPMGARGARLALERALWRHCRSL